ncbi:hypothetical protein OOT00_02870 [Desulfobotulus sp. H1]|uniref:Uncharacterized protein n=1 Tax=Desulfobotulus pelophilus TaxID=2823377 RepID=A0ABT3N636_9BACT|nr:hypothetical protein [Desulfobotulus pelophilus]MCW7752922.1 hypothetical protein [Desulfobotulus pelophilus]
MSIQKYKKRLEDLFFRLHYLGKNWRQILHLSLGTAHFGVNNQSFSPEHSLFRVKGLKKITGLPVRIRMMRARAFMGFIPLKDAVRIFPGYAKRHGYINKDEGNE